MERCPLAYDVLDKFYNLPRQRGRERRNERENSLREPVEYFLEAA